MGVVSALTAAETAEFRKAEADVDFRASNSYGAGYALSARALAALDYGMPFTQISLNPVNMTFNATNNKQDVCICAMVGMACEQVLLSRPMRMIKRQELDVIDGLNLKLAQEAILWKAACRFVRQNRLRIRVCSHFVI